MSYKLLNQQLKSTIRSLKEQELDDTLKNYEQLTKLRFEKVCRMVSYKCYEASILCKGKKANGYGRSEQEATINCIKNLFEFLMEDESNVSIIMQALKKDQGNPASESTSSSANLPPSNNGNASQGFSNNIYANNNRSKVDKVNNTMALNLSIHQNCDSSFDMRGDLETLSKNIGNISMINNSRMVDNNPNVSQIEMDDFVLKMMLENPEKAKNYTQMNSQNLGGGYQYANAFVSNLKKTNPSGVDSKPIDSKKILGENVNIQNQGRYSYSKMQSANEALESMTSQKQPVTTLSRNNSFNKENLIETETREMKQNQRSGSVNVESQRSAQTKIRCSCGANEELVRAKTKIESLESRIKALMEENRALRQVSAEHKESEKETFKSTDMLSNISSQLTSHHKSTFEKVASQTEMHSHPEDFDSTFEDLEKQSTKYSEKQRSQSVDIYSKRKAMSSTDVSGEQSSKPDAKKMIPRLRLDMLPNYHMKNQRAPSPVPSLNLSTTTIVNAANSSSKSPVPQQVVGNSYQNISGSAIGFLQNTLSNTSLQKLLIKK